MAVAVGAGVVVTSVVVVVVVEVVFEIDQSMLHEEPPTHSPVLVWQFERTSA